MERCRFMAAAVWPVAAYNLGGKTLPFYRGFLVSILELYHHSQKVTDI